MDDRSHSVDRQLDAAARNIHDTLTALSKDPDAHGRTDVYRAGMGDIFPADPDPRFFIAFTVQPEPPTLDELRDQLRAHALWQALKEGTSPETVLGEQAKAAEPSEPVHQ